MSKWRKGISWFVVIATTLLVAFDTWLAVTGKATYSSRITAWNDRWPLFGLCITASLSVLCGHWFLATSPAAWPSLSRVTLFTSLFIMGATLGGRYW